MIIDVIVAVFVTFGFYLGYSRGIIRTIFDTLSLIIGIIAALKLSPITIDLVQQLIKTSPGLTFIIGIVLTFIVVMVVIRFIGRKFESILQHLNINFINKLSGGILQALFFAYLLSMVIMLLNTINVLNPEAKSTSITYPIIEPIKNRGSSILLKAKPMFTDFWTKTMETMDEVKAKSENK